MRTIQLTQGRTALVDDADYERIAANRWYYHRGYAKRKSKGKTVYMHREILGVAQAVDHKNGDGTDNRRENIRPCTQAENTRNRRPRSGSFKGVARRGRKWMAYIRARDGRQKYLGTYDDATKAAAVYDLAAREIHGEFARTNFVGGA